MKRPSRLVTISVVVVIIVAALYVILRWVAFSQLQRAILKELSSLEDVGVKVTYKTIETSAWNRSILIEDLEAKLVGEDSTCQIVAAVERFKVSGIALLPLLTRKELQIGEVSVRLPKLVAMNNFRQRPQKDAGRFLKKVFISKLSIDSASLDLRDSTSCAKYLDLAFSFSAHDIEFSGLDSGTPSIATAGAQFTNVRSTLTHFLYKLEVESIQYERSSKSLKIDSLKLNPLYSRTEFAQKAGKQTDQFTCSVPHLVVNGIDLAGSPNSLYATDATVGFNLSAYRDKRIPRKQRKPTELPVKFLKGLPFRLQLDSVTIKDSFVSYEEVAEKGDVPGKVFFDKLNARIGNVSNISTQPSSMVAQTRFMDAGDLRAEFKFPAEEDKAYWTKGSITDFSMPSLNVMLKPVAKIEIESGTMKELSFEFQYNAYRSDGKVQLRYSDLKVNGLNKAGKTENVLVSFLMKIFLEKDLDANDKASKHEGTIEMYRNPQRGLFNYWWNSILSGVKSVYGFDKIVETNGKKKVGK